MLLCHTSQLIEGVLARGVNLAEAYIDALGDTAKHKASPGSCLVVCSDGHWAEES